MSRLDKLVGRRFNLKVGSRDGEGLVISKSIVYSRGGVVRKVNEGDSLDSNQIASYIFQSDDGNSVRLTANGKNDRVTNARGSLFLDVNKLSEYNSDNLP